MFGRGKPGYFRGRHYSTYVNEVTQLKRDEKIDEAERLLLVLLDAIEAENAAEKLGVAPWYYEQLAIIYRQRKDYAAEIRVLERADAQPHRKGPPMFAERLAKAKALLAKQT
jgi:hypothetical protein